MVRFIDQWIRIQARISHDTVDKVVHDGCNTVYTSEALVEGGLRFLLG